MPRKLFKRRSGAGASAQAMADAIRADERHSQHRTAAWALPASLIPTAGVAYIMAAATNWYVASALFAVVTALTLRRVYRSKVSSWATGAAGERRTRRILAPLVWCGLGRWAVLHDRQIPHSRANLDQLVIGCCGVVYVDTKTWKSKTSKVRIDARGELWYGRYSQQRAVETVIWEAQRAAEVLGHPVRPIIAVHYAAIPPGGLVSASVTIIQATELRRHLRSLPKEPGWTRIRVRQAALLADQQLRPAA
ncbi:nuclease-related domain-containing protein [Streptomyces yaizuensis]|uniref:NERD domain-containing protein n=1 Tax=Streptomyces yaizuensis TaxID=2989713 RepID=A0ABQ5P654_9ACTN|nr:nuclease-related domain-containing protein [Streptomyces sp. YSPA8]GLF98054.1 NERD domain-containing protein [Streptomyces sp. YSPA8]